MRIRVHWSVMRQRLWFGQPSTVGVRVQRRVPPVHIASHIHIYIFLIHVMIQFLDSLTLHLFSQSTHTTVSAKVQSAGWIAPVPNVHTDVAVEMRT